MNSIFSILLQLLVKAFHKSFERLSIGDYKRQRGSSNNIERT